MEARLRGFTRERDKEEERGKIEEKREKPFFILFDGVVYIILISCM